MAVLFGKKKCRFLYVYHCGNKKKEKEKEKEKEKKSLFLINK